jgi:hypothetical protein
MVTGDAPATAAIVAHAVGLNSAICPAGPIPDGVGPEKFAVFTVNFSEMWSVLASMLGRIHRGGPRAYYSRPDQRGAAMTRHLEFFDIRGLNPSPIGNRTRSPARCNLVLSAIKNGRSRSRSKGRSRLKSRYGIIRRAATRRMIGAT